MSKQQFTADILPTISGFDGWGLTTFRHWKPKLIEARFEVSEDGKTIIITKHDESVTIGATDFDSLLNSMKTSQPAGFVLVRPDAEKDIEYVWANGRPVKNFNEDGVPKGKSPWYAIVKHRGQVPMFAAWLSDAPEDRGWLWINEGAVIESLCRQLTGKTSGAMGRGFRESEHRSMLFEFANNAEANV